MPFALFNFPHTTRVSLSRQSFCRHLLGLWSLDVPDRAAKQAGVVRTTADSVSELRKLAAGFPAAEVLLRIRQDDPSARCQLGNKYGAEVADIPGELKLSFHHWSEVSHRMQCTKFNACLHWYCAMLGVPRILMKDLPAQSAWGRRKSLLGDVRAPQSAYTFPAGFGCCLSAT